MPPDTGARCPCSNCCDTHTHRAVYTLSLLVLGQGGVPVQTVVTHTHRAVYTLSLLVLGQGVPVQTVVTHTHRAVYALSLLVLGQGGVPVQTVVTHTHRAVYTLSLLVLGQGGVPVQTVVTHTHRAVYTRSPLVQGGVPVQTVVNHLHTHRAVYTRSPLVQGQGGNPLIPSALKYAVKDLGDNAGSIHEMKSAELKAVHGERNIWTYIWTYKIQLMVGWNPKCQGFICEYVSDTAGKHWWGGGQREERGRMGWGGVKEG